MSIHFACENCGHAIDVGDQFAGKAGHCKHCGQTMTVPATPTTTRAPEPADAGTAGFKLRPIEGIDVPQPDQTAPTPLPALQVRPLATADPAPEAAPPPLRDERPIKVLDPYHFADKQKKRTHLNPHYETRFARFVAHFLRVTRDRLYLLTLFLLVVILIGFLFTLKPLIHLGTVGVVVVNIAMLVDGVFYLVVLPFRHSLAEGLGVVLVPPYALYYWYKHWDRMRKPVWNTVTAFTPLLLAGLAYFFYEESGVIWSKVEQADQVVEQAIGVPPRSQPGAQPRQPSVTDQAKQVLGNESNIIQQLAQPQ